MVVWIPVYFVECQPYQQLNLIRYYNIECLITFGQCSMVWQEYSDNRDAEDAVYHLDGVKFDGSRIAVEFARPLRVRSQVGVKMHLLKVTLDF